MNLEKLFNPKSVAVVGASRDETSVGYGILRNLASGCVYNCKYCQPFSGKIFPINPHTGSIFDLKCYKSILDIIENIDLAIIVVPSKIVLSVVKDICELKQICTQSAGLRPFGVSLLIGGINNEGPVLYETDPTGIYFEYRASVIGEGEPEIEEILHKEYKPEITIEEGLKLCLKSLKKVLGDNFSIDRIDAAYIRIDERKFKKFKKEHIEKYSKAVDESFGIISRAIINDNYIDLLEGPVCHSGFTRLT